MKSAETIFRQHLKEKGMLVSRQQEQILATFMKTKNHPTVDDIYGDYIGTDGNLIEFYSLLACETCQSLFFGICSSRNCSI